MVFSKTFLYCKHTLAAGKQATGIMTSRSRTVNNFQQMNNNLYVLSPRDPTNLYCRFHSKFRQDNMIYLTYRLQLKIGIMFIVLVLNACRNCLPETGENQGFKTRRKSRQITLDNLCVLFHLLFISWHTSTQVHVRFKRKSLLLVIQNAQLA